MSPSPPEPETPPARASAEATGWFIWLPDPSPGDRLLLASFRDWLEGASDHNVRLVIRESRTAPPAQDGPVFIFYPESGWSDRELARQFRELSHPFFLRLFETMVVQPGETSPVEALWSQAYNESGAVGEKPFSDAPFLGCGEEDSFRRCAAWMLSCEQFVRNLESEARVVQQAWVCRHLIESFASGRALLTLRSESRGALARCLVLHSVCRDLREQHAALCQRQKQLREDARACGERIRQTAQTEYLRTCGLITPGRRVSCVPLAPKHLDALERVEQFARLCEQSGSAMAGDIAAGLRSAADHDVPSLCVIGPFSSGKTTLLNSVLLGSREGCAFATKTVANTAIIYDIRHVLPGQKESAEITFHEEITVDVYRQEKGDKPIIAKDEISILLQAIERGDIFADEHLEVAGTRRNPSHAHGHAHAVVVKTVTSKKHIRKYLKMAAAAAAEPFKRTEQITFKARVLLNRCDDASPVLAELGLFRKLALETPEDWKRFQGHPGSLSETQHKPAVESKTASLLVERITVHLDSPILRCMSIADTPGLGSCHPNHDRITHQYLRRAEGFIVFLPGNGDHAHQKVEDSFKMLTNQAEDVKRDPLKFLQTTAFVINLWQGYNPHEMVEHYRKRIADAFSGERADRAFNEAVKIFVVRLGARASSSPATAETIAGYPSLKDFGRWLEDDLMKQSALSQRFRSLLGMVTTSWQQNERSLRQEIRQLQDDDKSREKRAQKLIACRNHDIPDLARRARDAIAHFLGGLGKELENLRSNPTLGRSKREPCKREEIDNLCKIFTSAYDSINELLDDMFPATSALPNNEGAPGDDPAQRWFNDVESLCAQIGIIPPAQELPDFSEAFHPKDRLSLAPIGSKIEEIKNSWPGWLEEFWIGFTSLFGEKDIRCQKAADLFSVAERDITSLIKGVNQYLHRVGEVINAHETELLQRIDAELQLLASEDATAQKIREIEIELSCLAALEKPRHELSHLLESLL